MGLPSAPWITPIKPGAGCVAASAVRTMRETDMAANTVTETPSMSAK